MRLLLLSVLLLLAGASFADQACIQTCCEKYGFVYDEHGCNADQSDPNFNKFGTCSGNCIAGVTLPTSSGSSAPTTSGSVPPSSSAPQPEPYQEPQGGGCLPMFGLLGLVALGFIAKR